MSESAETEATPNRARPTQEGAPSPRRLTAQDIRDVFDNGNMAWDGWGRVTAYDLSLIDPEWNADAGLTDDQAQAFADHLNELAPTGQATPDPE